MDAAEAKKKLFEVVDKINEINNSPFPLTNSQSLELSNLEVKKMEYYSLWKD